MVIKKIVVIDDEKDLCFLVKEILEETGEYSVFVAHDGQEGKDLCIREKPDLIFVDLVMPKAKGDEVVEYFKKNPLEKKPPIILMSGLGEMVYFQKKDKWQWLPNTSTVKQRGTVPEVLKWRHAPEAVAREIGVLAFLAKPFSKETLLKFTKMSFVEGAKFIDKDPPPGAGLVR